MSSKPFTPIDSSSNGVQEHSKRRVAYYYDSNIGNYYYGIFYFFRKLTMLFEKAWDMCFKLLARSDLELFHRNYGMVENFQKSGS